jgi:CHASE3 domain sensor protein
MNTWMHVFGRASLLLVSVIFVLSLMLVVLWQLKLMWRLGRELDQQRQAARRKNELPETDAYVPPSWN